MRDPCDSFAKGTAWDPTGCNIAFGGTVTWHFDQPDAQFPHDSIRVDRVTRR